MPRPDPSLVALLPDPCWRRYHCVPLSFQPRRLTLGMTDDTDITAAKEAIASLLEVDVVVRVYPAFSFYLNVQEHLGWAADFDLRPLLARSLPLATRHEIMGVFAYHCAHQALSAALAHKHQPAPRLLSLLQQQHGLLQYSSSAREVAVARTLALAAYAEECERFDDLREAQQIPPLSFNLTSPSQVLDQHNIPKAASETASHKASFTLPTAPHLAEPLPQQSEADCAQCAAFWEDVHYWHPGYPPNSALMLDLSALLIVCTWPQALRAMHESSAYARGVFHSLGHTPTNVREQQQRMWQSLMAQAQAHPQQLTALLRTRATQLAHRIHIEREYRQHLLFHIDHERD